MGTQGLDRLRRHLEGQLAAVEVLGLLVAKLCSLRFESWGSLALRWGDKD